MTFYPLAFYPAPRFLQYHIFAVMKDKMTFQNDARDVLLCSYFQAYIKYQGVDLVSSRDLLVTQMTVTVALTLPELAATGSARVRAIQ